MKEFIAKIKIPTLVLGDAFFLYLSLWIILNLRLGERFSEHILNVHFWAFSFIFPLWIASFYIFGLYDLSSAKNTSSFYWMLLKATILNGLLSTTVFYLFPNFFEVTPKTNLFLTLLLFGFLSCSWRYFYNLLASSTNFLREVIIIGKNSQTDELVEKINSNPQLGYRVSSVIDIKKIGSLDKKFSKSLYTIVCPLTIGQYPKLAEKLYQSLSTFNFETFPDFYEKIVGKVPLDQIDKIWFLGNLKEKERGIYERIKRLEDIALGFLFVLVTIVVFPLIALIIKIDSPGLVFYKQIRRGKNGKEFNLVKFRSMKTNNKENKEIWREKNVNQVTKVGKFLRQTHLDELPQSWNILKGDISIVGPRPEWIKIGEMFEKEIPFYSQRYLVRPGITGWAQLHFPASLSIEEATEKFQYDLYYIKNRSFLKDIGIILKTINLILKGKI